MQALGLRVIHDTTAEIVANLNGVMEDLTKEGAGSGERRKADDARHGAQRPWVCLVSWRSWKKSPLNCFARAAWVRLFRRPSRRRVANRWRRRPGEAFAKPKCPSW
ncbi:MAG: hypothetical protein C4293_19410 [Nitrospiraceae bacterium]